MNECCTFCVARNTMFIVPAKAPRKGMTFRTGNRLKTYATALRSGAGQEEAPQATQLTELVRRALKATEGRADVESLQECVAVCGQLGGAQWR